jgi:hypothetical protein
MSRLVGGLAPRGQLVVVGAPAAYERMMSGKARFRVVVDILGTSAA